MLLSRAVSLALAALLFDPSVFLLSPLITLRQGRFFWNFEVLYSAGLVFVGTFEGLVLRFCGILLEMPGVMLYNE